MNRHLQPAKNIKNYDEGRGITNNQYQKFYIDGK